MSLRSLLALSLLCLTCSEAFAQRTKAAPSPEPGWPEVFNPFRVLNLNLSMTPADWLTVQNDTSYSIEVPATFWADGESPLNVLVRRKSGDALTQASGYKKVSLKIDINDLVSGQKWHELTKLSLENGDDADVVAEGFSWALHRMASAPEGYAYPSGMASWVNLTINGVWTGVYVNVEQPNKQFLRNRELYTAGETWLYKYSSVYQPEVKVGTGNSPTFLILCYPPFDLACTTPNNQTLTTQLPVYIEMQGLLTLGAVDLFTGNPDACFSKGKNFYHADFLGGQRRLYFPWDQDSVLGGNSGSIWGQGDFANILFNVPAFRTQYLDIFTDLLDGPMSETRMHAFLNMIEPVLTPSLAADPNNQLPPNGTVHDRFVEIHQWITDRVADVRAEIAAG